MILTRRRLPLATDAVEINLSSKKNPVNSRCFHGGGGGGACK